MISTVDPDTRHAHKTQSRQQDDYKAHIVIEPDTGLITAAELTKASGPENSDGAVGARLLAQDSTVNGTGVRVLAASAYGTGDMLAALASTGIIPVIKPWPLRLSVEGGLTLDDFTVDEAASTWRSARPTSPLCSSLQGHGAPASDLQLRCPVEAYPKKEEFSLVS